MERRITATILSLVAALSAPAVFAHEDASPSDRSWRGATDQLHLSAGNRSAIVELLAPKFGIEGLPRGVSAESAIELLDALNLVFLDYALSYVDAGRAAERLGLGPTMTVERTIEFLDVLKVGIEPTPLFQRISTYVDVGSFLAALDELGIALPSFVDPATTAVASPGSNGRIVWHVGPNVRTEHWRGGLRIHADNVVWPPGAA